MELLALYPHRIVSLEQLIAESIPMTRDGSRINTFSCVTPSLDFMLLTVFRSGSHDFRAGANDRDEHIIAVFKLMSSPELMRFLSGHDTLPDYVPILVQYILKQREL